MSLKSNFNELYDNGHTRPDIGKIEWTIWKRFREVKEQHEQLELHYSDLPKFQNGVKASL